MKNDFGDLSDFDAPKMKIPKIKNMEIKPKDPVEIITEEESKENRKRGRILNLFLWVFIITSLTFYILLKLN